MKKVLGMLLVVGMMMSGCGSDEPSLSAQDAGTVYASVSGAMGQVQSEVMSGMGQTKPADAVTVGKFTYTWDDAGNVTYTGTVDGSGGGTATVEGTGRYNETGGYEFSFDMTFNGYTTQAMGGSGGNITLDGAVSLSYSGDGSINSTIEYTGSVDVTGAVSGSVEFDLTITMSSGSVTFEGTVGGQSIGGSASY